MPKLPLGADRSATPTPLAVTGHVPPAQLAPHQMCVPGPDPRRPLALVRDSVNKGEEKSVRIVNSTSVLPERRNPYRFGRQLFV